MLNKGVIELLTLLNKRVIEFLTLLNKKVIEQWELMRKQESELLLPFTGDKIRNHWSNIILSICITFHDSTNRYD